VFSSKFTSTAAVAVISPGSSWAVVSISIVPPESWNAPLHSISSSRTGVQV
jgi:hypothetical protein